MVTEMNDEIVSTPQYMPTLWRQIADIDIIAQMYGAVLSPQEMFVFDMTQDQPQVVPWHRI